jgi:hypothetical protein
MATSSGLKLSHILILVGALAVLALLLLPSLAKPIDSGTRIRCRNNLNQISKGMATYLSELGGDRFYPFPLGRGVRMYDFNGAEWLASVYWAHIIVDPTVYNCPTPGDSNHGGRDLGAERAPRDLFGSQTVSYAGMHYYSLTDKAGNPIPGAIPADYPSDKVMACDDTEGTINHGDRDNGGMAILFFDSHVEYWTHTKVDLEHGVGQGELAALRN